MSNPVDLISVFERCESRRLSLALIQREVLEENTGCADTMGALLFAASFVSHPVITKNTGLEGGARKEQ